METNVETKSEQARRASLARKVHRGGRPRRDDQPEKTAKLYARDLAVLKAYAAFRGTSLKQTLNVICHLLIHGGEVPARSQLAPTGWRLIR